jgi:hypothetical protein
MKISINFVALVAVSASALCVVGCSSDSTAANPDQLAAQRDSQLKAMGDQRKTPAAGGATSADAAAKAKPPAGP